MIKIVAKMLVKEGMVEEFKKTAEELVKKSQAEEGCIFYSLNVSVKNPRLLETVAAAIYGHRNEPLPEQWPVDAYAENGYAITAEALAQRCQK